MLSNELQQRFSRRLLNGLVDDGVLRGGWAEELVAHYLQAEPQRQWSYFDLKWRTHTVSVKHSVGRRARFDVAAKKSAWDYAHHDATGDCWREAEEPAYWCDLYVFAHLPIERDSPPTLDEILEPAAWRFAVCSRADMIGWFFGQKAASFGSLEGRTAFVHGNELSAAASASLVG